MNEEIGFAQRIAAAVAISVICFSALAQHRIHGRVVVDGKAPEGSVPVIVESASGAVLTRAKTGVNGDYDAQFASTSTINVIYGNAVYLPETVMNLSGQTDHELTKVLTKRPKDSASLGPEQGQQVVATLEHMKNNSGNFRSEFLEVGLVLEESTFPPKLRPQVHDIKAAAVEIAKKESSSMNLTGVIVSQDENGWFIVQTERGPTYRARLFNDALCGNKVDGILKPCDTSLPWKSGKVVGQRVEVDAFVSREIGIAFVDRIKVQQKFSF